MRVKRGKTKNRKHNRILKKAKGYAYAKSHRYKSAKNQLDKSMQYATRDRYVKKRVMRSLWILRINAQCRQNGVSYSSFINGLKQSDILIDRRMLQEIARTDAEAFSKLVELAKKSA